MDIESQCGAVIQCFIRILYFTDIEEVFICISSRFSDCQFSQKEVSRSAFAFRKCEFQLYALPIALGVVYDPQTEQVGPMINCRIRIVRVCGKSGMSLKHQCQYFIEKDVQPEVV